MLLIYGNDQTWAALGAEGMESVYDKHRALLAETRTDLVLWSAHAQDTTS